MNSLPRDTAHRSRPAIGWALNDQVARRFGYPVPKRSPMDSLADRVEDVEAANTDLMNRVERLERVLELAACRATDDAIWDAMVANGFLLAPWQP